MKTPTLWQCLHLAHYLCQLRITCETGTINLVQRGFASPTRAQHSSYKVGTGRWGSPEGWAAMEVSMLI